MEQPKIKADLIVADVLACWPQTISVFLHHRMACIGCHIAPFETLAEVAAIYGLELTSFIDELEQTIDQIEK